MHSQDCFRFILNTYERNQENKCLCFSSSTSDYNSPALQKALGHLLPFGKKMKEAHSYRTISREQGEKGIKTE